MQNKDFHVEGFYEDYLMGKLSGEVETMFEEHLLFCEKCRKGISTSEALMAGINKANMEADISTKKIKAGKSINMSIVGVAASILIIMVATMVYFTFPGKLKVRKEIPQMVTVDTLNATEDIPELPDETERKEKDIEKVDETKLLAQVFEPSAFYENLVGNTYRAGQLKVMSPQNGQTFLAGAKPVFAWDPAGDMIIVIMNNQGDIVVEEKITSPYACDDVRAPGLYYWQIENENEALYTGKFFVR